VRARAFAGFVVAALTVSCLTAAPSGDSNKLQDLSVDDPNWFRITYTYIDYIAGDTFNTVWITQLDSDGTFFQNATTSYRPNPPNVTRTVPVELASNAFDMIMSEGFCHMLDRYMDLGSPSSYHEDVLKVECSAGEKSVAFEGYSMWGLMPGTYKTLMNTFDCIWYDRTESMGPLNVSLEITASPVASQKLNLSAVFTNNEEFMLSQCSVCLKDWHLSLVRMNGRLERDVGGGVLCCEYFEPGTTSEFEPYEWNWSGVAPGFYVLMIRIVVCEYIIIEVPEASGAVNMRPSSEFSVSSSEGDPGMSFEFDATRTCDWEDNASDVRIRWDWGGDGEWDTDWSENRVLTHEFESTGRHYVRLEVMDSDGATNSSEVLVIAGATSWTADESLLAAALVISLMVGVGAFVAFRRGHSSGGSG